MEVPIQPGFGTTCLRVNIYQASLRSRARSLGAYIVEEGGVTWELMVKANVMEYWKHLEASR